LADYRAGGGTVVFLDVSLEYAAERIGLDDSRPMIAGDTRARWRDLMVERRPVFDSLASFRVLTDAGSAADAAREIERRLRLARHARDAREEPAELNASAGRGQTWPTSHALGAITTRIGETS
jgi:hypothetical protein